jgi:hypothetical protein
MYMNGIDDAPFDRNLGFSLNPIKNIQQVAQKVQAVVAKVAPPIVAKLAPTNIIAQQASAVAKVDTAARALALKAAQAKASSIYKATAASPLGKKLVTPMLDAGAVKSPIGRQLMPSITATMTANQRAADIQNAQYAQQQKAADEQYQREYAQYLTQQAALDAQYSKDQAAADAQYAKDQAAWETSQTTFQPSDSWDTYSTPAPASGDGWSPMDMTQAIAPVVDEYATIDTPPAVPVEQTPAAPVVYTGFWAWMMKPITPIAATAKTAVKAAPANVTAWDPYAPISDNDPASYFNDAPDIEGNKMQLSNTQSSKSLPSNTFKSSGMGDIWGDLMTTGLTAYQEKTKATIAQSQAAQADATARIAAANAAAVNAQSRPALSTPVMLAAAAGLAGVLFFMRKRRA